MGSGGDTVDPLCAACAWQVDTDQDMGGSVAEWDFAADPDDADPDNLTTPLGADEAILDPTAYVLVYTDPTLTQCVVGIAVAVIAGGAVGFSPGTKRVRIRHLHFRRFRVKRTT